MRARDFTYLDSPTPVGLAHRGGAAYGPNVGLENTIAAFRRAVDLGYRYLETDVHVTRDGALVAFHDTVLDRVSDGAGAISDLSWEEVSRARIGGREPIPLLGEVLEEFPGVRVNIDIKSDAALAPTVTEVVRHGAQHRVCIGSFSERRIRAARSALGPDVATAAGAVGTAVLRFTPSLVSRLVHTPAPVLQIPAEHLVAGRKVTLVTPGLVRRAHREGKHVHAWFHSWSVEDAAEMHRLLDLGVDGIVTDHIDVLLEVFRERGLSL